MFFNIFFILQYPSIVFKLILIHRAPRYGNMCICHPFPYLEPTKNVFFFSNAFLFHIIINEFICNVFSVRWKSSPFHNIHNIHPHTPILCFSFSNPLDQCKILSSVKRTRGWVRVEERPFGKRSGWSEKKLKFYENSQNQPSSKIQMMFG